MNNLRKEEIINSILQEKKEERESLIKDKYFADSWEEAVQIGKDIDKICLEIKSLQEYSNSPGKKYIFRNILRKKIMVKGSIAKKKYGIAPVHCPKSPFYDRDIDPDTAKKYGLKMDFLGVYR